MHKISIPFKITKVDEKQRRVWGVATSDALDSQGDILDYEASKKAVADWMKIGNIREMHDGNRTVGKAFEMQADDVKKEISVGAYISKSADGENAWTKVEEGILQGFSVGGAVHKSVKEKIMDKAKGIEKTINRITDWSMSELSLVDNPANPSAMLTMVKSADGNSIDYIDIDMLMKAVDESLEKNFPSNSKPLQPAWWVEKFQNPEEITKAKELYEADQAMKLMKRDFSDKQRQNMADKGQALPDGSFPIANKSDLANAVKAYGRAKDPAKAKAHIISRAKALNATSELPDSWNVKNQTPEMKKAAKLRKDFFGVSTLTDCAMNLTWFRAGEVAEDDTETVKAIDDALAAIKQAITSELDEVDDADVIAMADAIEYGKKTMDLKKVNVIHGDERNASAASVADTKATAVEGGTPVTRPIHHVDGTKTIVTKSAAEELGLSKEQVEGIEKLIGGKLPSVPPRTPNPAADRPEDVKDKDDNDNGEDTTESTDGQPDAATPATDADRNEHADSPDGDGSDGKISDSADGSADAPTPEGKNADDGTAADPKGATPAASTDTVSNTRAASEPGTSDSADGNADAPTPTTDADRATGSGGDHKTDSDAEKEDVEDDDEVKLSAQVTTLQKSVSDLTDRLNKNDQSGEIAKSLGEVGDSIKKVADLVGDIDDRLRKVEAQPLPGKRPVASFTEVVKGQEGSTAGNTDQGSGMSESEILDLVKLAKEYELHPNRGTALERGEVMRKLWKVKDLASYMSKVN